MEHLLRNRTKPPGSGPLAGETAGVHPLFVYGTLRRGFRNHRLLGDAPFFGTAKTKARFAMYVSGVPYVVLREPVSQILGEVYEVDGLLLAELDIHEGHPRFYLRVLVDVALDTGAELKGWLYSFGVARGRLVPSGDYADAR